MPERIVGLIPAAGKGTRAGLPFPKELLPITYRQDQPITVIESALFQLARAGVEQATIVTRPYKEAIRQHLGHLKHGVRLSYVQQHSSASREGLPDALSDARDSLRAADLVVMLMGDVYFTDPQVVVELLARMREFPNATAGVSIWPTWEPQRFGVVSLDNDWLTAVTDKPVHLPAPQWFWGAVAFRPAFWPYIQNETQTLSRALDSAVAQKIITSRAGGTYLDLGSPRSFIEGIMEANGGR